MHNESCDDHPCGVKRLDAEVEDMAVDDSGAWLAAAASSGGAHVFTAAASGPSKKREWQYVTALNAEESIVGVAWAPSSFYSGPALLTSSNAGAVTLWRSVEPIGKFEPVYRAQLPAGRLSLSWATEEYGRVFAVGGSDGCITVFRGVEAAWVQESFIASSSTTFSIRSLCFSPSFLPSSALLSTPLNANTPAQMAPLQILSCDGSSVVSLWVEATQTTDGDGEGPRPPRWVLGTELPLVPADSFPHSPSWREVAWAKNSGLPFHYVAAGSEEGYLAIWVFTEETWVLSWSDNGQGSPVTRLSWSEVGTFLLVSYADGSVKMWRETPSDGWAVVSQLGDS